MTDTVIKIENLGKQYRLGTIGGETLTDDIRSWWARKRGKEDPTAIVGLDSDKAKTGKKFWALKGINLEVHQGERIGIIGVNGAGKSTLLKILSRVTAPTEGIVTINGTIASMLEVGTGFHGELTGRENIYLNGAILGMTRREIDTKIKDIIDFSECAQFIDTPVKRYSSGMYVKLAFAVAAHLDSSILIMDEVLAVGDMKFQEKCLGKMGDVSKHEGKTVLYVSHNMNTIRKLCNRCIVLEQGRLIYEGNVEKAISFYADKTFTLHTHNDLETMHPGVVKRIEFQTLDFLNTEDCVYKRTDKLHCRIKFYSYENIMRVHVRFIMRWEDDTPIGTYISEEMEIHANTEHVFSVILPLKEFPSGRYYIRVTMSCVNSFGTHGDLGRCEHAGYFTVDDNNDSYYNLDWIHWGWGAFMGRVPLNHETC